MADADGPGQADRRYFGLFEISVYPLNDNL